MFAAETSLCFGMPRGVKGQRCQRGEPFLYSTPQWANSNDKPILTLVEFLMEFLSQTGDFHSEGRCA